MKLKAQEFLTIGPLSLFIHNPICPPDATNNLDENNRLFLLTTSLVCSPKVPASKNRPKYLVTNLSFKLPRSLLFSMLSTYNQKLSRDASSPPILYLQALPISGWHSSSKVSTSTRDGSGLEGGETLTPSYKADTVYGQFLTADPATTSVDSSIQTHCHDHGIFLTAVPVLY